ncbi:tetratricopeptide repeat protein [Pseudomonas sp. V98_8]|jgi:tetratricopeptide (TPR) repeat protein|uniref:tetratricopeptide repeat protein n=1 Tax=Pseudomonas sp. V98_8 TaxID=3044228 RepID=UPI00249E2484|nr:tetratricopeptide repeat protein [Pseudomonas sp. V98_8]MDI3392372.1 tetratricopeptide repeat protein [Pseudomonas sp. V98_8]
MQGDFVKIAKNYSAKTAYLVFSAMSVPQGSFQMTKALAKFSGLILFLNDQDNNWYQHGIPGIGESTAETVSKLKATFESEGIERIVCIGASMGGYGAALYGELLEADLVICISCELQLGLPFSRSALHSTVNQEDARYSIDKIIRHNTKTKFIFVVGTSDIIDLYNISLVSDCGFEIYFLKNKNHFLTQDLHTEFSLETIIQDFETGRGFPHESWLEESEQFQKDFLHIDKVYELYVAVRRRNHDRCAELVSQIPTDSTLETAKLYTGMYYSRIKKYAEAENLLGQAMEINSANRETVFQLAICKRALGKFDEAAKLYTLVLEQDPGYAAAHHHLGMIEERYKNLDKAVFHFESAMAIKAEPQYAANLVSVLEKQVTEITHRIQELTTLSSQA